MTKPSTALAPREITDLVYRCCRVAGVDAGNAHRCATNVTHGEIHRGRSVQAFVEAVSAGMKTVMNFALASVAIESAEALRRSATFAVPTPLAAMSEALSQAALRGYDTSTCSDTTSADEGFTTIDFQRAELTSHRQHQAAEREAQAMRCGIEVESELVARITLHAAAYLVAERVVDAASEATD